MHSGQCWTVLVRRATRRLPYVGYPGLVKWAELAVAPGVPPRKRVKSFREGA
jgi:hypothetical protein